jgi:hypothetical protein
MHLSVKEMLLICAFHQGTFSKTLNMLHKAKENDPERMALIKSVTEKLESMNEGSSVSLHFDPEK